MKIKTSLFKYVSHDALPELKLKVIAGHEPLEADDMVTALFVLSRDRDAAVCEAAKKAFDELPNDLFAEALAVHLDPLVIKKIVEDRRDNEAILTLAILNTGIDDATLCHIAENCPEDVLHLMAEDSSVFAARPGLIEAVKKNTGATGLLIERLEGKATVVNAGHAAEPHHADGEDNVLNEEDVEVMKSVITKKAEADEHNIMKLIRKLSVSQKVKLAMSGNKSARELLIRESNKLVTSAVLKNPRITDNELLRLANTKGTSEDLLRQMGRDKEWMKNYALRLGVTTNPKTPTTLSIRLMGTLNDADVVKISKSKGIPGVLGSAAKRIVDAKAKKK